MKIEFLIVNLMFEVQMIAEVGGIHALPDQIFSAFGFRVIDILAADKEVVALETSKSIRPLPHGRSVDHCPVVGNPLMRALKRCMRRLWRHCEMAESSSGRSLNEKMGPCMTMQHDFRIFCHRTSSMANRTL